MSDLSEEELSNNMSTKDEDDSFPELSPTNFPELSRTNSEAKDELSSQSPAPASKAPWGDRRSMAEVAAAAHRKSVEAADSGYRSTTPKAEVQVAGPVPKELQSRLQAIERAQSSPPEPEDNLPPTHEDLQADVEVPTKYEDDGFPELSPSSSEAKDKLSSQSPVPSSKAPWGDGRSMAEVAAAAHRRAEEDKKKKRSAREHRKSADSGYKTESSTAASPNPGVSMTSQSPGPTPTELQSRLQAIERAQSSPPKPEIRPPTVEDVQAKVEALQMELQALKTGSSAELATPSPGSVHPAAEEDATPMQSPTATQQSDEWEALPAAEEKWKEVGSRSPRVSRKAENLPQVAASSAPRAAGDDGESRSRKDKEREKKRAQRQRRRRAGRKAKATEVVNEDEDSAAVAEAVVDVSEDDQEKENVHRGWWAAATAFFSGLMRENRR